MKYYTFIIVVFALIFNSCNNKPAEKIAENIAVEQSFKYKVETMVPDLEQPWGMAFLPDGSMLITEKKGVLIHFKNGKKTIVEGLPKIENNGQGGLLDIILDPKYRENGWIYFSYAANTENDNKGSNTAISRAKLVNNKLVNLELLYKATPNTKNGVHYGSRFAFNKEGFLFFSIGDRGNHKENPQDITRDAGKVYRINPNGTIPSSNPFFNVKDTKKAIFSYGNRNIQGMAVHPVTGEIWTHEHGPKGGDEINIIKSGKNYGWPKVSYGINYDGSILTDKNTMPGMENPIHYWVPSIAPSGMAFVTGNKYPEWKGNLLVGSLKFQYLNMCVLNNNKVIKEEKLLEGLGRVRNVIQAPDGFIYVAIEFKGIVRITPVN
ncbi:MAG: PQQ-dependent sugar dehydrogenase [Lutibacter sp.]|nr:PQQ-dependent sugar dehydrogenase [Lutibacter sp.]